MNALDKVVLDQYKRIKLTHGDPRAVLDEMRGEILDVATPELTFEIIRDRTRVHPENETRTLTAQMRAFQHAHSIGSRATRGIRTANGLVRCGMLAPKQGYVGGIIIKPEELRIYGHSMAFEKQIADDPIQEAMGDKFYPPMMWVKALRAAAYENRPDSARFLSVAEYLAKLGLSLGSMIGEYGDLLGATGFMPGERLQGDWDSITTQEHIQAEEVEAFRLTGLCDQAVVDPHLLTRTPDFAKEILELGGSLN